MAINRVFLIGHLARDPEYKNTSSDSAVCSFTLATNETWYDKERTKQERTEWSKIETWGKLADICHKHLKKGDQAFIEGKLRTRDYVDKKGEKKYVTEIIAANVQFIGRSHEKSNPEIPQQIIPTQTQAHPGREEYDFESGRKQVSTSAENQQHFFPEDEVPF